jgi:hypothetical protein
MNLYRVITLTKTVSVLREKKMAADIPPFVDLVSQMAGKFNCTVHTDETTEMPNEYKLYPSTRNMRYIETPTTIEFPIKFLRAKLPKSVITKRQKSTCRSDIDSITDMMFLPNVNTIVYRTYYRLNEHCESYNELLLLIEQISLIVDIYIRRTFGITNFENLSSTNLSCLSCLKDELFEIGKNPKERKAIAQVYFVVRKKGEQLSILTNFEIFRIIPEMPTLSTIPDDYPTGWASMSISKMSETDDFTAIAASTSYTKAIEKAVEDVKKTSEMEFSEESRSHRRKISVDREKLDRKTEHKRVRKHSRGEIKIVNKSLDEVNIMTDRHFREVVIDGCALAENALCYDSSSIARNLVWSPVAKVSIKDLVDMDRTIKSASAPMNPQVNVFMFNFMDLIYTNIKEGSRKYERISFNKGSEMAKKTYTAGRYYTKYFDLVSHREHKIKYSENLEILSGLHTKVKLALMNPSEYNGKIRIICRGKIEDDDVIYVKWQIYEVFNILDLIDSKFETNLHTDPELSIERAVDSTIESILESKDKESKDKGCARGGGALIGHSV